MDKETFNLLYNIGKTLNEGDGYCSKNGCSFNSDFLNNGEEESSISRKKNFLTSDDETSIGKSDDNDEQNDFDDPKSGVEFHSPVLGSNLISGKY